MHGMLSQPHIRWTAQGVLDSEWLSSATLSEHKAAFAKDDTAVAEAKDSVLCDEPPGASSEEARVLPAIGSAASAATEKIEMSRGCLKGFRDEANLVLRTGLSLVRDTATAAVAGNDGACSSSSSSPGSVLNSRRPKQIQLSTTKDANDPVTPPCVGKTPKISSPSQVKHFFAAIDNSKMAPSTTTKTSAAPRTLGRIVSAPDLGHFEVAQQVGS
jgi:hypothetical protein